MTTIKPNGTKERIMAAAEDIFARKGFTKATVREICGAAKVNTAAINYHFQDKQDLYYKIMETWMDRNMDRFPVDMGTTPESSPEEKLYLFVLHDLYRLFLDYDDDQAMSVRRGKLFLAELTAEEPNMDILTRHHREIFEYCEAIVADILETDSRSQDVIRCTKSVLGQCIHYFLIMVAGFDAGENTGTPEGIQPLARHITTFSLGGIRAVKETLDA